MMTRVRVFVITALMALPVVALGEHLPRNQQAQLLVGFLPTFSTERLVSTFEPLIDYLGDRTGLMLKLETAPSLAEFQRRTLEQRRYDVLFTASHFYYLAQRQVGYRAIARVDSEAFRAVMVVRADGALTSISQLEGRPVSMVDGSALETVLARSRLRELGLDAGSGLRLLMTPNNDASLQALLRGRTRASVLAAPFLRSLHPEVRNQLQVLFESSEAPPMPVSVAPWVSRDESERLRVALLAMGGTSEGQMVLRKTGWRGFAASEPGEYAAAKALAEQVGR